MSGTAESSQRPTNRHAPTAIERQRIQLDKLLKDPTKSVYIPSAEKEKTIRPPREMMKNVQGSSAGAGSGEFHVYKASRRREYERLKLLDETAQKETEQAEFERRKREAEQVTESKTARNRAKRQKKKDRAKGKGTTNEGQPGPTAVSGSSPELPMKKRRLINGKEIIFRKSGRNSDDGEGDDDDGHEDHGTDNEDRTGLPPSTTITTTDDLERPQSLQPSRVLIHED